MQHRHKCGCKAAHQIVQMQGLHRLEHPQRVLQMQQEEAIARHHAVSRFMRGLAWDQGHESKQLAHLRYMYMHALSAW